MTADVCSRSDGLKKISAFPYKAVGQRLTVLGLCKPLEFLDKWREVKEGYE